MASFHPTMNMTRKRAKLSWRQQACAGSSTLRVSHSHHKVQPPPGRQWSVPSKLLYQSTLLSCECGIIALMLAEDA